MRLTAWATAVALLWLTMMERAVHALFVVSLAALGLSPTLLAIPLLFSAFIYPLGLRRLWPHTERFLTATTLVALAAILLTIVAPGSWAVISAAVSVLALTVLLFDVMAALGALIVLPSVLAVLLAIALRTLNGTAAPGLTDRGIVLLVIVVIAAAALRYASRNARPARSEFPAALSGAAAVIAFLLVEYQLLASPSQLSTLHVGSTLNTLRGPTPHAWWFFALLVASQIGLLIGLRQPVSMGASGRALGATIGAHLASITLLITGIGYFLAPIWLIIAQATAVYLLTIALAGTDRTIASAATRAGIIQVGWWLLVVLHAFSAKWPFLPAFVWPLLQGKATLYLLLSFTILPLAVFIGACLFDCRLTRTNMADLALRAPATAPKTVLRAAWTIAALSTVLLAGLILFRAQPDPQARDTLRLMTLNAQFFMAAENRVASNLDALSDLIAAEMPDVIALQESDANSPTGANQNGVWWLSHARGLNYYYGPPTTSYTPGVAMLTQWPVTTGSYALLPASHSIPRGVVDAVIAAPGGPIQVIVAHVQWAEQPGEAVVGNREDQVAQIEAILRLARTDMPSVIMGDFNAGPGYPGPAYDMLGRSFVDAWVAAGHPMDANDGYTWPSAEPNQRIDQIWLSKGDWTVTPGSARVLGTTGLSDHRAVIVAVRRTR